jgi:hypothetical protein
MSLVCIASFFLESVFKNVNIIYNHNIKFVMLPALHIPTVTLQCIADSPITSKFYTVIAQKEFVNVVSLQVLTETNIETTTLWDIEPYILVEVDQRFRG